MNAKQKKIERGERVLSDLRCAVQSALSQTAYPDRCPGCDCLLAPEERHRGWCADCAGEIALVTEPFCLRCGRPLKQDTAVSCDACRQRAATPLRQVRIVFHYRGPVRQGLLALKYHNRRRYADLFGRDAALGLGAWIRENRIAVLVPIPVHQKRRRQRGYNQAELIARALSKEAGIPMADFLVRLRKTTPQKELTAEDRYRNLQDAFAVDPAKAAGVPKRRLLLVDDIYTTGATLESAAAALSEAGFCDIDGLCIAGGEGIC